MSFEPRAASFELFKRSSFPLSLTTKIARSSKLLQHLPSRNLYPLRIYPSGFVCAQEGNYSTDIFR